MFRKTAWVLLGGIASLVLLASCETIDEAAGGDRDSTTSAATATRSPDAVRREKFRERQHTHTLLKRHPSN